MVSAIERRKAWARRFISAAPTDVQYGSDEWLALPEGPAKWGVAIRAAECWQTDREETLQRIEAARKASEDAAYAARIDQHRRNWSGRGFRPDPAIADDIEREWLEWVSA